MARIKAIDTTGPQYRVGYDTTNYADFAVSSGGDLTVTPTGGDFTVVGNVSGTNRLSSRSARYKTAAAPSIPNSTTTIVNYATSDYDTHSAVTTGASWKFTASVAGIYDVAASVMYDASSTWADGELASLKLYKNGVFYAELGRNTAGGAASKFMFAGGVTSIKLAATDYIDIRTFQSSGGALTLIAAAEYNHVSIDFRGTA